MFEGYYRMTPYASCGPNTYMNWNIEMTLSEAKKECSENPDCHMFYDEYGNGEKFRSCRETADIRTSPKPYKHTLYQLEGNKSGTKFQCMRDIL